MGPWQELVSKERLSGLFQRCSSGCTQAAAPASAPEGPRHPGPGMRNRPASSAGEATSPPSVLAELRAEAGTPSTQAAPLCVDSRAQVGALPTAALRDRLERGETGV